MAIAKISLQQTPHPLAMDIYANSPKNTYVTGITKLFVMPTDSGGIPAVAVSKKDSLFITSAYTILMMFIFMVGWNLIIAIVMAFWPTHDDPNRQTVLVALWNSGESMNAITLMASYCIRVIHYMLGDNPAEGPSGLEAKGAQSHQGVAGQGSKTGSNDICPTIESVLLVREEQNRTSEGSAPSNAKCRVSDLLWGLLFVFIALAMTVGNIIAGILVPVQLSMGNVAPPAKDAIFYPDITLYGTGVGNVTGVPRLVPLFSPPVLRALGSIEASEVTVRKRVNVVVQTVDGSSEATYNYSVTGVDMGLQSDPKLQLKVKGSCRTDYTWLLNSTKQEDTYRLFGGNNTLSVKYKPELDLPPNLQFEFDYEGDWYEGSNTSYAMIINTRGRYSNTPGQDPWYLTGKSGVVNASFAYQVAQGRPVLSCWEDNKWHLNGKEADTRDLDMLPGLKLDRLWVKVFQFEFAYPRVTWVGLLGGQSALKSASSFPPYSYILDAGASTIKNDLERLVMAAWVSSRNVLRDTTTYDRNGMQNSAEGPGGSVEAASAQFVLQSGNVVTLSARILISVPSMFLFLLITQQSLSWALRHSGCGQKSILPDERKNGVAMLATQLYRRVDQRINSRNWKHTGSRLPFVYPSGIVGRIAETNPDEELGGANTH